MDTILQFLTGVLRYVLPVLALLILAVCVISLFRNRPRVHKKIGRASCRERVSSPV